MAKFEPAPVMARKENYRKQRFGDLKNKIEPYYHHLDLRPFDNLDDDGFAYLIDGVKGVDMLDLNELEITNKSIALLSRLEYIKELRAKGCHKLDNGCITDLNKITSLEFLHLRFTAINIDGLLQLNNLINLKTLMFSADDVPAIKYKLLQLKGILPQCEFVIDGKTYYFNTMDLFIQAFHKKPYGYRLKIKNEALDEAWSKWISSPTDGYLEAEAQGPYSFKNIEWLEIDPVEKRREGRLAPVREIDHSETIIELLEKLSMPFMVKDRIISTYIVNTELQ